MSTAIATITFSNTTFNTSTSLNTVARRRATSGQPRLRMTQRGRAVLVAIVATPLVIVALLFALNGGQASASLEGSATPFQYVTVASGESLWQLAGELAPAADPRDVIDQIVRLNQLASSDVFAGQELAIPTQYAQK